MQNNQALAADNLNQDEQLVYNTLVTLFTKVGVPPAIAIPAMRALASDAEAIVC